MFRPRLSPLKGYNAFSKVYQTGKKFYFLDASAVVSFRNFESSLKKQTDVSEIFYGVSISKKKAKSAVIRNRIKRLLRISIKNAVELLIVEKSFYPIETIIINWNKAPEHSKLISLNDVNPVVLEIFKKVLAFYESKNKVDPN